MSHLHLMSRVSVGGPQCPHVTHHFSCPLIRIWFEQKFSGGSHPAACLRPIMWWKKIDWANPFCFIILNLLITWGMYNKQLWSGHMQTHETYGQKADEEREQYSRLQEKRGEMRESLRLWRGKIHPSSWLNYF